MKSSQIMYIVYHEPTKQGLKGDNGKILIFRTAEEARAVAYSPEHAWITSGVSSKFNKRIAHWMELNGDLQTIRPRKIMIHFGEFLY